MKLPRKANVDGQGRISIAADVREDLGIDEGDDSVWYQVFRIEDAGDDW